MQKHHTPNPSKGSTKDDLTTYQARASKTINLLFDDDTPSFVTNLLRTWLNELENETQVFYNVREVAEVALPLMLQRADELGLDPESGNSKFARRVVQDLEGYLDMSHDRAEERTRRALYAPITPEQARDLVDGFGEFLPGNEALTKSLLLLLCGIADPNGDPEKFSSAAAAMNQAASYSTAHEVFLNEIVGSTAGTRAALHDEEGEG